MYQINMTHSTPYTPYTYMIYQLYPKKYKYLKFKNVLLYISVYRDGERERY